MNTRIKLLLKSTPHAILIGVQLILGFVGIVWSALVMVFQWGFSKTISLSVLALFFGCLVLVIGGFAYLSSKKWAAKTSVYAWAIVSLSIIYGVMAGL